MGMGMDMDRGRGMVMTMDGAPSATDACPLLCVTGLVVTAAGP